MLCLFQKKFVFRVGGMEEDAVAYSRVYTKLRRFKAEAVKKRVVLRFFFFPITFSFKRVMFPKAVGSKRSGTVAATVHAAVNDPCKRTRASMAGDRRERPGRESGSAVTKR